MDPPWYRFQRNANQPYASLGLGYCARHYVAELGTRFDRVVGTTRSGEAAGPLGDREVELLQFEGEPASPELVATVAEAQALLVSAAPAAGLDPVLAALG